MEGGGVGGYVVVKSYLVGWEKWLQSGALASRDGNGGAHTKRDELQRHGFPRGSAWLLGGEAVGRWNELQATARHGELAGR